MLEQIKLGEINDSSQRQPDVKRPVLDSLYQFKKNSGHFNESANYKEFVNDPLGTKKKALEEQRRREARFDDFIKSIQFLKTKDNKTIR